MNGPRLYFMSTGDLIGSDFFKGHQTVEQYIDEHLGKDIMKKKKIPELKRSLNNLKKKGVILEF